MLWDVLAVEESPIPNERFGNIINRLHRLASAPISVAMDGVLGMDSNQHVSCRPKLFQLLLWVNEAYSLRAPYCHDQSLGSR